MCGFRGPKINDAGTVVFQAQRFGTTDAGIFTGPDPVADRVITQGDALDGSTVVAVDINLDLNRHGQVALLAVLDDGRTGLYLASPAAFIFADGFESGDTSAW